ncbi:MAG: DUF6504 family protein [Ktedonobacterales bacterium]
MSRRYGEPISVVVGRAGQPQRFTWRRITYIVEVIAHWHLADKWWDAERQSDRQYYRVMTRDLRVFEVYHEQAPGRLPQWILDVVLD